MCTLLLTVISNHQMDFAQIVLFSMRFNTPGIHEIIIRNENDTRVIPSGNSELTIDRIDLEIADDTSVTTSSSSSASSSSTSVPTSDGVGTTSSTGKSSTPTGAIVGGVIGGIALVIF